jgi:hypothetical protein
MGFDYTFRIKFDDGKTRELTYQKLIKLLGIARETCHGRPLTAGGTPQALTVKGIIEREATIDSVEVWHGGSQLF